MDFLIREILPQDNARLASIIRRSLVEFGANRSGFAWDDPELDALYEAYQHKNAAYYVTTVNENVVGGGGFSPLPCKYSGVCELQKLYLTVEHRGKGIGKALTSKLLQKAQHWGYRGCYLETLDSMQSAVRLYESLGFQRIAYPLGDTGHCSCNTFYLRWFDKANAQEPFTQALRSN